MQDSFYQFFFRHLDTLSIHLLQHIYLALSATLLAVLLGIPVGIIVSRLPKLKTFVFGLANIFQTIPSLALLAFLIPFLGIGTKPTVVTLTLYALLPILRNTVTGLKTVPAESIEAAEALGFNYWQKLWIIELPLALPIIIAGIRTATAMTVGITTIAAFIGAGGLGDFITQGLALNNTQLILLGAIPTALLALLLDYLIHACEILLNKRKRQQSNHRPHVVALPIILFILIGFSSIAAFSELSHPHKHNIVVATKNFTEEFVLGYLISDLIQAKTPLHVIKKFNLGTTLIVQNALLKGEVDLYPEYSGTAYIVVLHHKKILSANETFHIVKNEYKKRFHLIWLQPFGYNNSQTLAVRASFAKKYHLHTLSDLAKLSHKIPLTIAANAAFIKRPDALPGLVRTYQFRFKDIIQAQHDLTYSAIQHHLVSVIQVYTTDGRLVTGHLVPLKDDKHFYPPYYAAPVIRESVLEKYPQIDSALSSLDGLLTNKIMQNLNYQVDILHRSPAKVARDFLLQHKLL